MIVSNFLGISHAYMLIYWTQRIEHLTEDKSLEARYLRNFQVEIQIYWLVFIQMEVIHLDSEIYSFFLFGVAARSYGPVL